MTVSFDLHPVVAWAWIIIGVLFALSILIGVSALLMGDEIRGWQEDSLVLMSRIIPASLAIGIVLTVTSFIFN